MITKEDYLAWKADPVTKAVYASFYEKIKEGVEELSYMAGDNPASDNRRVGKIAGLRTFTDMTYYDLEPDND